LAGEDDSSALIAEQNGTDTPYHLKTVAQSEGDLKPVFKTGL
jgi:hypothetical protein